MTGHCVDLEVGGTIIYFFFAKSGSRRTIVHGHGVRVGDIAPKLPRATDARRGQTNRRKTETDIRPRNIHPDVGVGMAQCDQCDRR